MLNWVRWSQNLVPITPTSWKHLARSWHSFDCGLSAWLWDLVRRQLLHWLSARTFWSHFSQTVRLPMTQQDCWPCAVSVSEIVFDNRTENNWLSFSGFDFRELLGCEMGNKCSRYLHLCQTVRFVPYHRIWWLSSCRRYVMKSFLFSSSIYAG